LPLSITCWVSLSLLESFIHFLACC